jgi:hypothetical protein
MSLSEADPNELLMDIGLNAFARALAKKDTHILPFIKQKLEPRLGYTLKRYIDQHINSNPVEVTETRKEMILGRIEALVKAGSIDSEIARFFVGAGETREFHVQEIDEESEKSGGMPRPEKSDGWHDGSSVV